MSSRRAILLFVFLAALGFPSAAAAAPQGRVECKALRSQILGRAVRYCVLLPPGYDASPGRRYPVVYHLHGIGDNEQSLVNFGGWGMVENLQAEGRIGEYIVVTPDGGRSFYINSRDGRNRYEDFFIREFLPAMDRGYRTRAERAARGISGISMGGYGALRLAFKYPHLFASVSAHSAALMERLPPELAAASRANPRMNFLGSVFGQPLDPAFWDRQSPFTLARQQGAGLRRLKIYFDCGASDRYGFETGAQALSRLLRSLGVPHEAHIYPGGHDWTYFAEHLGASLEFHSRAFGLEGR